MTLSTEHVDMSKKSFRMVSDDRDFAIPLCCTAACPFSVPSKGDPILTAVDLSSIHGEKQK